MDNIEINSTSYWLDAKEPIAPRLFSQIFIQVLWIIIYPLHNCIVWAGYITSEAKDSNNFFWAMLVEPDPFVIFMFWADVFLSTLSSDRSHTDNK